MYIYLISNNALSNNLVFDNKLDIETKKQFRPLTVEGTELSQNLILTEFESLYCSYDLSSIETSKFLANKKNVPINLDENLSDCAIGDLKKQSLKMLSYFQEHDFDYKLEGGESLNDCGNRIDNFINKIRKNKENAAIVLPRRALFSYLLKYTDQGFNLDERLVLMLDDEVLMESVCDGIEIFKISSADDGVQVIKINQGVN